MNKKLLVFIFAIVAMMMSAMPQKAIAEKEVVIAATPMEGVILSEGFENGTLPEGWTVIDNDGDGYNWGLASMIYGDEEFKAHSGNDMFASQSYANSASKALTPDNYLITPEVSGATSVKFYANAQSSGYFAEHLAVCASTTGKEAADFKIIEEWNMTAAKKGLRTQGNWYEYNINLPEGTKYVAFRHYDCTDQLSINIDDVTIFGNTTGGETATDYLITIAGKQLTSDDDINDIKRDAIKSGKVSYNPETNTLTLDNAVIEIEENEDNNVGISSTNDNLCIELKGNSNQITVSGESMSLNKNCTMTGDGSLQLTSRYISGIYVGENSTLTITGGCTVTASGGFGIVGLGEMTSTLIINGANVNAKGTNGSIFNFKEITLENCSITSPEGATIDGGNVMLNGEVCTEEVVITTTPMGGVILSEGFENGALPEGWTIIDNDGDEHNWVLASTLYGVGYFTAHSGNDMFCSESYDNSTQKPLTPDNYLITPEVSGATSVKFYANAQDANYPAEHLAVCVSTTGKEAADFKIIDEWTMTAAKKGLRVQGNWYEYNINLPEDTKYVAFRHYDCTDQFIINLDDVTIFGGTTGIENVTTGVTAKKQGIYTLTGVKMNASFDSLPAGIYIVNGEKVVKK